MRLYFGQGSSPTVPTRAVPFGQNPISSPSGLWVPPSQDWFCGGGNLLKPFPIDARFIATEFTAEDEPWLLRIAQEKKNGFIYSGLNDYEGMSVEENVHAYLYKEALAAQEKNPRRTYYLAIRDTQANNKLVGAIEVIGDGQERDGEAEVAAFVIPGYQNQGLLTRSLYAVLCKMLELGIKPLWAETAKNNWINQAILKKYGYKRVEEPSGERGIKDGNGTVNKFNGERVVYRIDEESLRTHLAEFSKTGLHHKKDDSAAG